MEHTQSERIEVFISYAHKDNEDPDPNYRWLERLMEHLKPLVRQDVVDVWSDQEIGIGEEWHGEIQQRLNSAKVAVLLVSTAFLASDYICNSELPVLLQKAKEQGLKILPVILNPCLFQETTFKYPHPKNGPKALSLASLQAGNSPNEPLSKLTRYEQDEKLLAIARRILKLVPPPSSKKPPDRTRPEPNEFIQRIRQEINKLLNRQKLRVLRDSLLQQRVTPPKDQPLSPIDVLIPPQEVFYPESAAGDLVRAAINDLREVTESCLKQLTDQGSNAVPDIIHGATAVLGWLALLAVREAWLQEKEDLRERLLSVDSIAIPVETEAGTEVVVSRLHEHQAKLALDGDGVRVFNPNRLSLSELELGIAANDRMAEIKKAIWKAVMKSDMLTIGRGEAEELRYTLDERYQRGESYYLIIPAQHPASAAIDPYILSQLRAEFPHLGAFSIGTDVGEQILVMPERHLLVLVREFLLMLRDYQ